MKHSTEIHTLKNGIELLAVTVPGTDVVSMGLHLLAGDAYVTDQSKYETAHIMEHLAFGANKKHPSMRLASEAISRNGAVTNASTSRQSMVYTVECAKFDWPEVADAFKTQLESPLFKEDEFYAEVGNVRDELIMRWDNPDVRLGQLAAKHFGHKLPTFAERLETIGGIECKDVVDHYNSTHQTADMRIIMVADFTDQQWGQTIKLFESIAAPKGTRQDHRWLPIIDTSAGPCYIKYNENNSVTLDIDFVSPGSMNDEENAAARILHTLCFGTFHSRVYGVLREKGLAYDIWNNFSDQHEFSSMSAGVQIDPENVVAVFEIVKNELDKLANQAPTKAEMQQAIDYSCGRFAFGTQTVGALGGGYSQRFFRYGEAEDYYAIPDRYRAVSAGQVQDLLARFYQPGNLAVAAIGPEQHSKLSQQVHDLLIS